MTAEKKIPQVTLSSTKKELMDAYLAAKEVLEKRESEELKPEVIREERKKTEIIKAADGSAEADVPSQINSLKSAIAKELGSLAEKLDAEAAKYRGLQEAVRLKEEELKRIYDIDAAASALAALLEAQRRAKTARQEEEDATTASFERRKQEFQDAAKEEKETWEKSRKREKEEFEYNWKREKEQKSNALKDELAALEKQIAQKKADFDRTTAEREAALAQRETGLSEREKSLGELQAKVASFPETLSGAVDKAVKETSERLKAEFAMKEALLTKGFEGDRKVYEARIKAQEDSLSSQSKQLESLARQQEKAYEKVQDIATKAVAGAAKIVIPPQSAASQERGGRQVNHEN